MNDVATALGRLGERAIEVPSWVNGDSGTRFRVFGTPGTPRAVQEKIADAAETHGLTGLVPTVALHIPSDKVDDYAALKEYAAGLGVGLGAINSNTFQDDTRAASTLGEPPAMVSSSSEVATYVPFGHCPPFIVAASAHS